MTSLSILKWFGGKHKQLKYILPFPRHDIYLEIFGGGGTILLNKVKSKMEIYNDINNDLVNFWKEFRDHYFLFRILNFCLPQSKAIFDRFKNDDFDIVLPEIVQMAIDKLEINKHDLERAVSFFYKNSYSFSGNNDDYLGVDIKHSRHSGRYPSRIEMGMEFNKIWERIKDVQFHNRDYRSLLKVCDRKGVLIYLDPPYVEAGNWYVKVSKNNTEWKEIDFMELNDRLKALKNAMFVLSIDEAGKQYFENKRWYYQRIVQTSHASPGREKNRKIEYIIRNFDPANVKTTSHSRMRSLVEF